MIHTNFFCHVAFLLTLIPIVYGATAANVISTNSALTSQADTVDIAIVAITASTPATTVSQVPSSLQSLSNAIAAAQASLTPITPTSDPPTEKNIQLSWGLFANTMEELVDDLVGHSSLLINTFGLEAPIHTQLLNLNTTLFSYAAFMLTTVTDAAPQAAITDNTMAAYGDLGGDTDGFLEAFKYYP